jgi:hypothetical protein
MLAARTRQVLLDTGYAFVSSTIGLRPSLESVIYYPPGREGEAHRLAEELGASTDLVAPRPDEPVVRADLDYDVLLLLGDDWDEVSDLELALPQQAPAAGSID